jgi:hypothetical protein
MAETIDRRADSGLRQPTFRLRRYADARAAWEDLRNTASTPKLYHTDRWLNLLQRALGLRLWVATIEQGSEVVAACVLGQTKNPFVKTLASLPFSDSCPPLAVDDHASSAMLEALAAHLKRPCEIRGVAGPPPWQTVACFQLWSVDLARPLPVIERSVNGGLRRKIRRAGEAGVEISHGNSLRHIERYYALHAETRYRQGIPTQPIRLFTLLQETFSADDSLQVWLASDRGGDVAGIILLRDRDHLYYKWGARRLSAPVGASHMLLWEVIRQYAGKARVFDLGRTDVSNQGLAQFKKELGATAADLPYSFFPKAPRHVSAEALSGMRKTLSRAWTHLPFGVAQGLGGLLYPYLG